MQAKINIGIVEDQFLFREGIKAILTSWPDLQLIFESTEGYSVLEKLEQSKNIPDVMLVDFSLPALNGKEFSGEDVTHALIEAYPAMKIVILSVHDDENFIARVIKQGAHGYLVKDCDPRELHEAILAVHAKGTYINERSLKAIQNSTSQKIKPADKKLAITRREIDILELTCKQFTAEEIAEKLFISVKTVNGHRNNLLQKTGSRNVTGLVIYAIKNQLVALV